MIVKPKGRYLIEISQEVMNPIGGVYTVIRSKVKEMVRYYGKNYFLIGPCSSLYPVEFKEEKPPRDIKAVFDGLSRLGIICYYGRWIVEGRPQVFLVDSSKRINELNEIKDNLTKKYNIDFRLSNNEKTNKEIDELIVWGDSTTILIEKLIQLNRFKNKIGVIHLHNSGIPVLPLIAKLRDKNAKVGLVLTLHATSLGRKILMNKENLYSEIKKGLKNKCEVSKNRVSLYGQPSIFLHQLEKLGAKRADVVTAVSGLTSKEARYILGREADVVTPNGVDLSFFPTLEDRAIIHSISKEKIHKFLNAYFLPYYPVDVKDSLLFFSSGRYELITKGYEIFLEALGKLNNILKKKNSKKNIFVFLFIMKKNKEPKEEVIRNLSLYWTIEQEVNKEMLYIKNKVMGALIHGYDLKYKHIFDDAFLINTKKIIQKLFNKKNKLPPVCAHRGLDKGDSLLELLKKNKLENKKSDKVKVIFYPAPVSVSDGLLSMDYFSVISGMQLGVFPSLYEPWGYTALETALHGVMGITTDAAGFGRFIQKINKGKKEGVFVLKVLNRKEKDITNELVKMMYKITKLSREERIKNKIKAYELATLTDWKRFAKYYIRAHNLAIERCKKRLH